LAAIGAAVVVGELTVATFNAAVVAALVEMNCRRVIRLPI